VRRKESRLGRFEIAAFFVALGVAGTDLIFYKMAMDSPTGTLDGAPPQSFYVIGALAALAVLSDLNLILRGGLSGAARIARHLWRMCAALFVAAGSFFLGQPQVFPAFLHGSPILFVPVIAPLALMIFWLLRVGLTNRFRNDVESPGHGGQLVAGQVAAFARRLK